MGTDQTAVSLLTAVLANDVPGLVDADGITVLAAHRDLPPRAAPTLITPMLGELARLLGADRADIEARRLEFARRAAAELGITVLLEGSTTVIAGPEGGPVLVNPTGTAWLATAGSGDVLSGLAGALLAQGLKPSRPRPRPLTCMASRPGSAATGTAGTPTSAGAPIGSITPYPQPSPGRRSRGGGPRVTSGRVTGAAAGSPRWSGYTPGRAPSARQAGHGGSSADPDRKCGHRGGRRGCRRRRWRRRLRSGRDACRPGPPAVAAQAAGAERRACLFVPQPDDGQVRRGPDTPPRAELRRGRRRLESLHRSWRPTTTRCSSTPTWPREPRPDGGGPGSSEPGRAMTGRRRSAARRARSRRLRAGFAAQPGRRRGHRPGEPAVGDMAWGWPVLPSSSTRRPAAAPTWPGRRRSGTGCRPTPRHAGAWAATPVARRPAGRRSNAGASRPQHHIPPVCLFHTPRRPGGNGRPGCVLPGRRGRGASSRRCGIRHDV